MAEYECPNCGGGFPGKSIQKCVWCGQEYGLGDY